MLSCTSKKLQVKHSHATLEINDRWQWTGAQLRTEPTDPGTREEQALQGTQNPSRALFSCICCDGRCCYSKAELL